MTRRIPPLAAPALALACLLGAGGCINLAANLLHAIQGNNRPAEFDGLVEKRVALVCASDGGVGVDATSAMLTSYIHSALKSNVKKIDLVSQSEVERWLESHSDAGGDYELLGQGVGADLVVAVEVTNLRLRNGATLYRGESDIDVTVIDAANGHSLYRKHIPEFTFPKLGGPTTTDITESKFRAGYLTIVARTVSGLFYEVDATADFALDATANSF